MLADCVCVCGGGGGGGGENELECDETKVWNAIAYRRR